MQTLTFTKTADGNAYEAKATVTDDFALHIEAAAPCELVINGSSISETTQKAQWLKRIIPACFDWSYNACAYPKYLHIVVSAPVTAAYIVED